LNTVYKIISLTQFITQFIAQCRETQSQLLCLTAYKD